MVRKRAWTVFFAAVALLTFGPFGVASASGHGIGPDQHFAGLVNGNRTGAVIYTVCPGPGGPDRMGRPAGNQSVEVVPVAKGGGDTGSTGNAIYAYVPGSPPATTLLKHYDAPRAIPTSAMVPCGGRGVVYFSSCPLPEPCGTGAVVARVSVRFENIAT